jgi:hypothetical protein
LFNETRENFTHAGEWETSNDRDIDFKRSCSRRYYNYAIRYVVNQVKWKIATSDSTPKRLRYFAASWKGRIGMAFTK